MSLSGLAFGHWSATPRGGGQNATPKRWSQGGRHRWETGRVDYADGWCNVCQNGWSITGSWMVLFRIWHVFMIDKCIHAEYDPSCYSRFGVAGLGDHNHRFFHSMEPFFLVTLIYCCQVFIHKIPVIFTFVAGCQIAIKKGGCKKLGWKEQVVDLASCRHVV